MAIPSMLADWSELFTWKLQVPLIILLVAVVVFWIWYRRRQM